MKVKNLYKMMAGAFLLAAASQGLTGCSDTWDDHYDMVGANGSSSLLKMIEENPQLSDFYELLRSTHVYNNNHTTSVTYADLLNADQALTVWAPVNGTFNIDSLLNVCQTERGDSTVGNHFVMNHIAHNLYNMNDQTDENVKMLNDKFLPLSSRSLYNARIVDEQHVNTPATNGLLHVVDDDAWYTYNVYESLTSMDEFAHLGSFLSRYEKQELDEERSIQSGIEDGKKVYSDSVMVKTNNLFRVFDRIMDEDSTFFMLAPDAETWKPVYEEAAKYFNFGPIEKGDSIGNYWTHVSLMSDLFYNEKVQRSETDSVFSTSYRSYNWPYHVFYHPYEAGGLLNSSNIKNELPCSNGKIYRLKEWPFTPEDLFFHPIVMQGENQSNLISYDDETCTLNYRSAIGDTISGNAYLDIVPASGVSNWEATFEIRNTLSGTYDICAVILPKTVYLSNSRDFKPNKFITELTYMDENGEMQTLELDDPLTNDGTRVDTVKITRFTFPVCNYQQQNATVQLKIKSNVSRRETNYSREMFLDCIYLKPVSDEDNEHLEANVRKEAKK
ncbi:MAG: fasciclin domain-containing protein [Bacteroidaceae bacterium]|nr:fasciclin domain-containing protein [Bacteroidaceae bacterium]